jgi:3-hydroxyacyl-[acyl-carrier-protein] dehydratase
MITHENILEIQPNRFPLLMIDRVTDHDENKIKGYKNLTSNDWFFPPHWPGNPTMPGVLMIESIVQLGAMILFLDKANIDPYIYLSRVHEFNIFGRVTPGDRLDLDCELVSRRMGKAIFSGQGKVGDKKIFSGQFEVLMPNVIKQILPKNE